MAQRYRLKLNRLDFVSPVDSPAQETAKVLLLKRGAKGDEVKATARVVKTSDELGLVFCWAFTSTDASGQPYHDLQGDAIDQDFIKAAADFMVDGGRTDEMHDSEPDGRVVFAMPMTPEIAKAFGVVTKTTGLMVALKPSPDVYAKFKSGEYTGVSIAGLGTREAVKRSPLEKAAPAFEVGDHVECLVNHMPGMKGMTGDIAIAREGTPPYYGVKFDDQKAIPGVHKWLAQDEIKAAPADATTPMSEMKRAPLIRKEAVLTSTDAGHAHTVSLDDPARYWCDQLQTSYQTADGADCGHSHAWVFDAKTGAITVADDSGHSHTIDAAVPADVLALYAVREAQRDAENLRDAAPGAITDADSDGVPMAVAVEESSGSARVVIVQARAPQNKSTQSAAMPHRHTNTEKSQMDKDKQIADLTAKNAELEKRHGALSKMSAVAFAVFKSLSGADADAFIAKTATEQDAHAADIAKRAEEADKVIYVSKSTGDVYRAKDDTRLVEMAKRMDAQATEIKKAAIRKTAAELLAKKAPGDDETHDFIVEQLSGNEKAMECLKGLVASSKIGKNAPGFDGQNDAPADSDDALEQLEKGLTEFCKAQSIPVAKAWNDGLPAFVETEKGKALKAAYDASLAG